MFTELVQTYGELGAIVVVGVGILYDNHRSHKSSNNVMQDTNNVVSRELTPNGGKAMKDELAIVKKDVADIKTALAVGSEKFDQLESKINRIYDKLYD